MAVSGIAVVRRIAPVRVSIMLTMAAQTLMAPCLLTGGRLSTKRWPVDGSAARLMADAPGHTTRSTFPVLMSTVVIAPFVSGGVPAFPTLVMNIWLVFA